MFDFLENYRDVAIPAPGMDGVELVCSLGGGLSDAVIPTSSTAQLREFWSITSGGSLLVDEQFGICGLMLYGPAESQQRTADRTSHGYGISSNDWVLGEFVGDTDMLVIDVQDSVLISTGSYPRSQWYTFRSLSEVLSNYVEVHAEKYWEGPRSEHGRG
jgi:hypothetical protein